MNGFIIVALLVIALMDFITGKAVRKLLDENEDLKRRVQKLENQIKKKTVS